MHLFALALLMCNVQTSRCDWYVPAVYKSEEDCDNAAMVYAKYPNTFALPAGRTVEIINCRPTTPRIRRTK